MSGYPTITRRRIDANDRDFGWMQPDMCALIERHGVQPNETVWVEYDVFDTALLRFGLFVTADDGKRTPLLVCEHEGTHAPLCRRSNPTTPDCGRLATEPTERALIGDLPDWWQPTKERP